MKRSLVLFSFMTLGALAFGQSNQVPSTPTFFDIAKNADGTVKIMNQAAAIQYCLNPLHVAQPAHLPSARELAQLSMSLGAHGFLNECDGSDQGCLKVDAVNADGTPDSFYFTYTGYQRPMGDLGNYWFWSSSLFSYGPHYAFVLLGFVGVVDYRNDFNEYAVRCVSGP